MFEATLKQLISDIDGAVGAAVLNLDGVVVEAVDGGGQTTPTEDASREYAAVFKQLLSVGEAVEMGTVNEFTIEGQSRKTLLRVLSPHYAVAVLTEPDTLTPKGHFYLRVAAPDLVREL